MGAEIAHRIVRSDGTHLITAPTLDLLAQNLHEHREIFGDSAGRMIAVASDRLEVKRNQGGLAADQVVVTTNPRELAELLSTGRHTVGCTYQSLGVLQDAHANFGLRPWSHASLDEAHRTAGVAGKAWSMIHYDDKIPSETRVSLTATPRIIDGRGDEVVSMDDESIFGKTCFRFSFADAIRAGVLCDYELVVAFVSDEQVMQMLASRGQDAPFLSVGGSVGIKPQMLATQIAVLRAASEHGVKRMITYHGTIPDATRFVRGLRSASDLLDTHERPETLTTLSVAGTDDGDRRRFVFDRLGSSDPGLVVVSNARVLAEGVNIPAVDSVAFIGHTEAITKIIQAIGRALRSGGNRRKIARIIVPVWLGPGQTPESALETSGYAQVWRVVCALRAHDERFALSLDVLRRQIGEREAANAEETDPAQDLEPDQRGLPSWMSFSAGQPVPAGFAKAITLKMVKHTTISWEEFFGKATIFFQKTGHLRPPRSHPIYAWVHAQAYLARKGRLSGERFARLLEIGFEPDILGSRRDAWTEGMRSYQATHIGELPPPGLMWGDPPMELYQHLQVKRRQQRAGRLSEEEKKALDDLLGADWELNNKERRLAAERRSPEDPAKITISALAEQIAARRKKMTSQREAAADLGIGTNTLNLLEGGKPNTSLATFLAVAHYVGTRLELVEADQADRVCSQMDPSASHDRENGYGIEILISALTRRRKKMELSLEMVAEGLDGDERMLARCEVRRANPTLRVFVQWVMALRCGLQLTGIPDGPGPNTGPFEPTPGDHEAPAEPQTRRRTASEAASGAHAAVSEPTNAVEDRPVTRLLFIPPQTSPSESDGDALPRVQAAAQTHPFGMEIDLAEVEANYGQDRAVIRS